MAKIKMKHSVTVADFLTGKKAAGVSEKTLATYGQHFSADGLNKADLEAMIASMRAVNAGAKMQENAEEKMKDCGGGEEKR